MKMHSTVLAFSAALSLLSATSGSIGQQISQGVPQQTPTSCPSGLGVIACQAGQYGPGGCYNPAYAYCTQGIICSNNMRVCPNGQNSTCYLPPYSSCR